MQPLELLLIRHGESQFNVDGTGGLDSALTDLGRDQAHKLAPWLALNFQPAALYSSTMERAQQTAEIIQPALSLPIQFRDDLREVEFEIGPLMPQFSDPISALNGQVVRVQDMEAPYAEFQARMLRAVHAILRGHAAGTILIVTHGGIIATLLRSLFGGHHISVHADNTSATLLRWDNSRWYLVYSNRIEHLLDKDG